MTLWYQLKHNPSTQSQILLALPSVTISIQISAACLKSPLATSKLACPICILNSSGSRFLENGILLRS